MRPRKSTADRFSIGSCSVACYGIALIIAIVSTYYLIAPIDAPTLMRTQVVRMHFGVLHFRTVTYTDTFIGMDRTVMTVNVQWDQASTEETALVIATIWGTMLAWMWTLVIRARRCQAAHARPVAALGASSKHQEHVTKRLLPQPVYSRCLTCR